ncbi:response regulator [Verrucomicrobiota bacterium sgz303538]
MQADSPLRVFIAEDSRLFQHALLSSLALLPNIVVVGQAFTGEDAIAGIKRTNPDLVLLDVMMPRGDGFCVLRSIQASAESPLVVVLTFFAQESVHQACRKLGAHVVYDKADAWHPMMDLLQRLTSGEITTRSVIQSAEEQSPDDLSPILNQHE